MMRSALRRLTGGVFGGILLASSAIGAFAYETPRLKPPAPGPAYLKPLDYAHLVNVAKAVERKQFAFAKVEASQVADPIAASLADWLYYAGEDPDVDLAMADAFLDAHSDWPAISRIQSHLEKRLSDKTPVDVILALFESRDPVTGDGHVQLARALYATGARDAATAQLRNGWINYNFTTAQERRILSTYGGKLTKADHAARVDRLLFSRQVTNARRVLSRLETNDRRMAEARIALLLGAANATTLYSRLTRDQQLDPGVIHAAMRYYRRSGDEKTALNISRRAATDPQALRAPDRLWYERQLLMRGALKEKRFVDAYLAVAEHGLEPGGDYADAEFNAGWIALRFLNDPVRAETHFLALGSVVGTPISLSRAYYWAGRAAEAQGEDARATAYYERAAQYHYSYYGQLAAEELGGPALERGFDDVAASSAEDRALFTSRPTVAALRMLSDLNLDYQFMVFSYHIDDQLERPGEYIELAKLTNGEGAPHLTVRAGKVAIQRNAFAPDVAYPVVFVPEEAARFTPAEIILGLSRQESEFNPRAFSRAGARGMMQLIPTTAQITARKEGLRYNRSALLDDPIYNLTLGSAHLSHLMERYNGSLIMTFAAYNAGASRVDQWTETYGDPRSPDMDPVDWVEFIPFSETRNYVQRVLENTQVYRGRLNNAPIPGKLSADLERGGAPKRAARAQSVRLSANDELRAASELPPIPEATRARALSFASLMTPEPEPEAAPADAELIVAADEPEAKPRKRLRRRGFGRRAREETPEPAPAAPAEDPALEEISQTLAPATPAPSNAPPAKIESPLGRAPSVTPEPAAPAIVAPQTEPPLTEEPLTEAPAPLPQPAPVSATPALPDFEPEEEATVLPASDAAFGFASENAADEIDAPQDDCQTYREFLVAASEDVSADDLNAGMLAELQGGGSCGD